MQKSSLFAHFATASGAPERHATDGLTYILEHSATARASLRQFVQELGVTLPEGVHYESQVIVGDYAITDVVGFDVQDRRAAIIAGDYGIPDVVGFDAHDRRVAIIDGKFWSGLTNRQPMTYLRSLPDDAPGLLLFVAPAMRVPHLWAELKARCSTADAGCLEADSLPGGGCGSHAARYAGRHMLAVTSWQRLLDFLGQALTEAGEATTLADLQQLRGLCGVMDAEAFLPLTPEELEPSRGRRLDQLGALVDKVFDELEATSAPWLSSPGRWEGAPGSFGRNLQVHGVASWLGIFGEAWASQRATPSAATPLWLEFYGTRSEMRTLRQALRRLERNGEERFFAANTPEIGPSLAVAIHLPTGVEEGQVIQAVLRQLDEIAALLQPAVGEIVEGPADPALLDAPVLV